MGNQDSFLKILEQNKRLIQNVFDHNISLEKFKVRILSFQKCFMPCLEILDLGCNYYREDILRLYENIYFSVQRPNVITGLKPQDNSSVRPQPLLFTDHFSCRPRPDSIFLFSFSSSFALFLFAFLLPQEKFSELQGNDQLLLS